MIHRSEGRVVTYHFDHHSKGSWKLQRNTHFFFLFFFSTCYNDGTSHDLISSQSWGSIIVDKQQATRQGSLMLLVSGSQWLMIPFWNVLYMCLCTLTKHEPVLGSGSFWLASHLRSWSLVLPLYWAPIGHTNTFFYICSVIRDPRTLLHWDTVWLEA